MSKKKPSQQPIGSLPSSIDWDIQSKQRDIYFNLILVGANFALRAPRDKTKSMSIPLQEAHKKIEGEIDRLFFTCMADLSFLRLDPNDCSLFEKVRTSRWYLFWDEWYKTHPDKDLQPLEYLNLPQKKWNEE